MAEKANNYLPEHKKKALDKAGKLVDAASGLLFTGKFFMDFLGNLFKGKGMSPNPEPLIFTPDDEEETKKDFYDRFPSPNEKDLNRGTMFRYFEKDIPSNKVVELDKDTYLVHKKENKPYRKFFKVEWNVKGEVEDQVINGYKAEGIATKNQRALEEAEKQLPGISSVLSNPSQFVQPTQVADNTEVAGGKPVENLQTKPDQFVIAGTGVPYSGPYHIHPVNGPMVGAKHTRGAHPSLAFVGELADAPQELVDQMNFAKSGSVVQVVNNSQSETDQSSTNRGGTLIRGSY